MENDYLLLKLPGGDSEEQEKVGEETGVKGEVGLACPHFSSTTTSCKHCSCYFCNVCMALHMERLRFEIKWISNGFEKRTQDAFRNLDTKLAVLKRTIAGNVAKARQEIECESDRLVALIELNKQRLLGQVDALADEQLAFIDDIVGQVRLAPQEKQQLTDRIAETAETSPLFYTNSNSVSAVHKAVLERDHNIFELEELENGLSSTRIVCKIDAAALRTEIGDRLAQMTGVELVNDSPDENRSKNESNNEPSELLRLRKAVRLDDIDTVRLKIGANKSCRAFFADCRDQRRYDRTPLLLAAEHGAIEVAQFLLRECQADHRYQDSSLTRSSAIHLATREGGHLEIVRLLADFDPDVVSLKDADGNTALNLACQGGHFSIVEYLVTKTCANIENICLKNGMTPLLQAVKLGHLEIVRFLVEIGGANLLAIDSDYHQNALHLAAWNGHLEIVRYFLTASQFQLLIVSVDIDNDTPLHLAVQSGHLDVVRCLLCCEQNEIDALLRLRGCYNRTALLRAAANGHVEIVRFLVVDCRGDLYEVDDDEDGFTAIHLATYFGKTGVVAFLLDHEPSLVDLRSKHGRTILQIANEMKHFDIVELVKAREALKK